MSQATDFCLELLPRSLPDLWARVSARTSNPKSPAPAPGVWAPPPAPRRALAAGGPSFSFALSPKGRLGLTLSLFLFRFALLRASNSLNPLPNNSAAAGAEPVPEAYCCGHRTLQVGSGCGRRPPSRSARPMGPPGRQPSCAWPAAAGGGPGRPPLGTRGGSLLGRPPGWSRLSSFSPLSLELPLAPFDPLWKRLTSKATA